MIQASNRIEKRERQGSGFPFAIPAHDCHLASSSAVVFVVSPFLLVINPYLVLFWRTRDAQSARQMNGAPSLRISPLKLKSLRMWVLLPFAQRW